MAKKKAPMPPPRPKTKKAPQTKSTLSAQARAAIARTRKGRAELDALAAGADLSDLAHLPAMVALETPKPVSHKKKVEDDEQSEEPEEMAIEAPVRKARRASPKKTKPKPQPLETPVGASP